MEPAPERPAVVAEETEGEKYDHYCSRYDGIEGEDQSEEGRNGG